MYKGLKSRLDFKPITTIEKNIRKQINEEIEEGVLTNSQKPPIDSFSLVGIAWILASTNQNDKDSIERAKWIQDYLDKMKERYKGDPLAVEFFDTLLPILDAVVAKISLSRDMALKSIEDENEILNVGLKRLDQIANLGNNMQSIIVRILGAAMGGAVGAFPQISQIVTLSSSSNISHPIISPTIVIGLAIGYGLAELGVQIYKIREEEKIRKKTIKERKKIWDDEFTSETMGASLRLYTEANDFAKKIYNLSTQKFVREIAREFKTIAELYMQRPIIGTRGSDLSQFLQICSDIEYTMSDYIESDYQRRQRFNIFRKQQEKEEKKKLPSEPYKAGFNGLSRFLQEEKVIEPELRRNIMKVRKRRVSLILHGNYSDLPSGIDLAKGTLDKLETTLDKLETTLLAHVLDNTSREQ